MQQTGTAIGAWNYQWEDVPRPFVHPVTTPGGEPLSVDAPEDHWWHHALWFTIKFVNGENFWEEYDEYGLLVQKDPPEIDLGDDGSVLARNRIEWMRPGPEGPGTGPRAVSEELRMRFGESQDHHFLDWDIALTADTDTMLDRTPFSTWGGYGGLTFRGRSDWHHTELRLDDGVSRQRALGDRSKWCSLEGPLPPSEGRVGLVILDHPDNPRFPNCWYASTRADTYGDDGWSNFVNAAVLWADPMELAEGETLRLRHRVITYEGHRSHTELDDLYREWLCETRR